MNNYLLIVLIGLLCLYSCTDTKDKIKGNWIEVDNFHDPMRLSFSDFSIQIESNNRKYEKLYHVQNDTFYVEQIEEIYKSIIKIENDRLNIIEIKNDSVTQTFERNNFENLVDYINVKKGLSIKLPQLENSFKGTDYDYQNTLFADYVNNELVIFFNGKVHNLSDTSFLKISENNWRPKTQLFVDKELKLSLLNQIKTELRKAQLHSVGYVTSDNSENWITIGTMLPPIDSIGGRPLPPPRHDENIKSENIIIEVNVNTAIINDNKTDLKNCKDILKGLIKLKQASVIRVFFDEKLNYESYLNYLSQFHKVYLELRNEYAKNTYNVSDYLDLGNDEILEVKRKYPMRIHEVDKAELKKYAL